MSEEQLDENVCKVKFGILYSVRGMLLVIAMLLFAYMVTLSIIWEAQIESVLVVFGAFIGAGSLYFFKIKNDEALKSVSAK
jgi:flagellar motor component MotA